jgi:hypothetical protein
MTFPVGAGYNKRVICGTIIKRLYFITARSRRPTSVVYLQDDKPISISLVEGIRSTHKLLILESAGS